MHTKLFYFLKKGILIFTICTLASASCAGEITAKVAPWPNRVPNPEESIRYALKEAAFFVSVKGLTKGQVDDDGSGWYYGKDPVQIISFEWVKNSKFMKGTFVDSDLEEKPYDLFVFAKTPQEYFEKRFFLKDNQGKPVDPPFIEHRNISSGRAKAYVKYVHSEFQIYRIISSDQLAASAIGLIEMIYIFSPTFTDGFIHIVFYQTTPTPDRTLLEYVLFSLSEKKEGSK